MVKWVVTEGTAQDRFERAARSLGVKPRTRSVGDILVEVEADLPESFREPIRELLLEGTHPESLTYSVIESRIVQKMDDP